jgi:hypothetical protein
MIPYIVVLVFVLVIVLATVYKQSEGFELVGIVITEGSSVQSVINYAERYLDLNKALKAKLEAGEPFDEPLTESKAKELGMSYSKMADGSIYTGGRKLSEVLASQLELDTAALTNLLDGIQKDIESGKLKPTMTVREFVKKSNPESYQAGQPIDLTMINEIIGNQVKSSNAREALILKKLGGSKIAGVDATDLYGAVGGVKEAIKSSTLDDATDLTKPKETKKSEKEAAPPMSIEFTKETEERLAKSVASQLKDSLLLQRATSTLPQGSGAGGCPYAPYTSDATAQGTEYIQAKPHPGPDMSQYIRKDSIPCWNCSLP